MSARRFHLAAAAGLILISPLAALAQQPGISRKQESVVLPEPIMQSELTTLKHRRFKLADYQDTIIVVNTFASWCRPCMQNLSDLVKLRREYGRSRVTVLGLVSSETERDIKYLRKFLRKQRISFPVIWDAGDFNDSLVTTINGRRVLPQMFVIADGRVQKHFMGFHPINTPQILREVLDERISPKLPASPVSK